MIGHRPPLSVTTEHQPYNIKSTHLGNQSVTFSYYQTQAIFLLNRTTFCDPFLSKWTYSGNLSSCLYQHHLDGLCITSCVHKCSSCTRWQERQARLDPALSSAKLLKNQVLSGLWQVRLWKGISQMKQINSHFKGKNCMQQLVINHTICFNKAQSALSIHTMNQIRRRKLNIPCLY